ncbi:MAG: UDP-N-acetylmuramoyl-L-alanine--D-glutamate ligase [Myxococcales bacterium]|nr:UDP-N-acetylmuramoyl-L-alanine--D-glutamate ligase [Myxococcales bacterium]
MQLSELAGKRVLVLGLGTSGRSAAAFCASRGCEVVAADEKLSEPVSGLPKSVSVVLGRLPDLAGFDLIVPSPGVPPARYAGSDALVWGDIELAFRALQVPVIAVTGTNGKSTTVLLLETLLRGLGRRVRAAGNLGVPALSLVGEALDVAVLEVSSFQLETTESFRPRIGVLLNLSPDHLDRHGTLSAYADAKARLFRRQEPSDTAIVDGDDPRCVALAERGAARLLRFSRSDPAADAWWDGEAACLSATGETIRLEFDEPRWRAMPRQNLLAALLAVQASELDVRAALPALAGFAALPHRLQEVGCVRGVRFVDDSKATNPAAAAAALEATQKPIVWIAGGRDKQLPLGALMESAKRHARRAVFYGEAAAALAAAAAGSFPADCVAEFDAAVTRGFEHARPGDTLLLAPACASFDQFASFEARGDAFRAIARRLEKPS